MRMLQMAQSTKQHCCIVMYIPESFAWPIKVFFFSHDTHLTEVIWGDDYSAREGFLLMTWRRKLV